MFHLTRIRMGVVNVWAEVAPNDNVGGDPVFGGPTDPDDAPFTLTINVQNCVDRRLGVAVHSVDDVAELILPIDLMKRVSVTAELKHLSTYAVAAPGYVSGHGLLRASTAVVDTIPPDTATADTTAP
jgi:hypothetical protein